MPILLAKPTGTKAAAAVAEDSAPLFRAEAIAAQGDQFLGSMRIGHKPSFMLVTALSLAMAGALLAYATWGQVTRKARLTGLLTPVNGQLAMSASGAGTLSAVHVTEGQSVQAGQILFELATDRAGNHGETAALVAQSMAVRQTALQSESASRQLAARQRTQALQDRIRSIEAELRQNEAETELAERRASLAKKSVARFEELAAKGFVAEIQTQAKNEELIDIQTRVQAVQRTRTALLRDLASLKAEISSAATQLQTDLAQFERTQAAMAQESIENDARRQLVVTAAQSGVVSALVVKLGQTVQAGQTLATLLPQGPELEAHLYAPSRTAGFVQAGQAVWLRLAAYPYQKFGMAQGQVTAVSRTPIQAQDLPAGQASALMQAAGSNEPLYRINVKLAQQSMNTYGQVQQLKPGMALDADVVQDRRAIWEWVLEPVMAARQWL